MMNELKRIPPTHSEHTIFVVDIRHTILLMMNKLKSSHLLPLNTNFRGTILINDEHTKMQPSTSFEQRF